VRIRITCSSGVTKILPSPILPVLELQLGQEVDDVLGTAVQLRVALLPPETLHLRDRDALHTDIGERRANVVHLEGLDNRCDKFHGSTPCSD
jgi:hypothetical protein